MAILEGLRPQEALHYFEELCAIPHGSRDTKRISDYCVRFARERGLNYVQDEHNNVVIYKPASKGYENHPTVILQGHLDMVCEKAPDCSLDMAREGLRLRTDGRWIWAEGTTLGGDDGIAVAYALALLADDTIPHPPLEVILTVDEEIGMLGADAIDLSELKGRTMINLDSEDEGIFTVSCAGGATASIHLEEQRHAVYGPCLRFTVEGLVGGHSGVEIHKNRANANKVMGLLLGRVQEKMPLCLTGFAGGSKDNAIPRACTATVVAMGMDLEQINDIVAEVQAEVRETYADPDAVIRAENVDALGGNALTTEATARVIALLNTLPNGVQSMCVDMPELVQTSLNLGIAKLEGDALDLTFSVRSSVNSEKQALLSELQSLCEFYGGTYSQMGEYPAWEYRQDSPLREKMVEIYRAMFSAEPEVVAIHAGLECGILSEKLPGLDCVSIGPEMHDIHTSREKLGIASVGRMWNFLLEILKAL